MVGVGVRAKICMELEPEISMGGSGNPALTPVGGTSHSLVPIWVAKAKDRLSQFSLSPKIDLGKVRFYKNKLKLARDNIK